MKVFISAELAACMVKHRTLLVWQSKVCYVLCAYANLYTALSKPVPTLFIFVIYFFHSLAKGHDQCTYLSADSHDWELCGVWMPGCWWPRAHSKVEQSRWVSAASHCSEGWHAEDWTGDRGRRWPVPLHSHQWRGLSTVASGPECPVWVNNGTFFPFIT